jgi:hypothetical protein
MKPSNLERIDSPMFESVDPEQQGRVVGGVITHPPTHITTHTSTGQTDSETDVGGDLPTI